MLPAGYLVHTVEVTNPVEGVDQWGDKTEDFSGPPVTITGRLQQDARAEIFQNARDAEQDVWTLFTNSQVITVDARVYWPEGSATFEVFGSPEPCYGATGYSHTECTLRRVEG